VLQLIFFDFALDPGSGNDERYDDRVPGGGSFVDQVLKTTDSLADAPGLALADLIGQIVECFPIERTRFSKPSKERGLACAAGTVFHAAKRGEAVFREKEGLRGRFYLK